MDKIIKLQSKQGTFNTTDKLLADFTIPRGQVYNLRDSYLNVVMRVDTTDGVLAGTDEAGTSVASMNLGITDNEAGDGNRVLPNVALVKNAYMSSQNKGKIDDIRRVDALKTMLYTYEKDLDTKKDASYYSLTGVKDDNNSLMRSPFLVEEKEGTKKSQNKNHNVKIKLGEVFDICNEPLYDGESMGDTDIHLEFNFDKLTTEQNLFNGDSFWTDTEPNTDGTPVGASNGKMDDVAVNNTGGNVNITSLTTTRAYDNRTFKEKSGFWVGQRLVITGNQKQAGQPDVAITQSGIVSNIVFNETNGKFTLTFGKPIVQQNNKTLEDLVVKGHNIGNNATITIPKVEMVLKVDESGVKPPSSYTYYSYDTEIDNHNNRANVRKNYMIDSNCVNCYIQFGSDIVSLISGDTGTLTSYRVGQDNVDMFGRQVDNNSPLHRDLISSVYRNNQRVLKNVNSFIKLNNQKNHQNNRKQQHVMFPTLENPSGQQSIINLELNSSANPNGISEMKIFQEKLKSI